MAKKERQACEKVDSILSATRDLFAVHGFDNTPIAQIADQARVAGGTVIYHFKTKENLLFILCRQILYNLFKEIRNAMNQAISPELAIERFILGYQDFVKQNPQDYLVLLNADPFQLLDVTQPAYLDLKIYKYWIVQLVEEALHQGIEQRLFPELPVMETAQVLVTMMHCAAKMHLLPNAQGMNLYPEALRFAQARLAITMDSDTRA